MNRRFAFVFALLVALAAPHLAWAQGQGNAQGQGQGQGQNNGNGQENSDPSGNGSGQNNGNGNAGGNRGNSDNGNRGTGTEVGGVPAAGTGRELSESDVLDAVEAGRAVSLSTILPDVRSRTGGEVINAQLQQVRGFLVYAVKVLTPEGKVTTEYYYARSGLHVGG